MKRKTPENKRRVQAEVERLMQIARGTKLDQGSILKTAPPVAGEESSSGPEGQDDPDNAGEHAGEAFSGHARSAEGTSPDRVAASARACDIRLSTQEGTSPPSAASPPQPSPEMEQVLRKVTDDYKQFKKERRDSVDDGGSRRPPERLQEVKMPEELPENAKAGLSKVSLRRVLQQNPLLSKLNNRDMEQLIPHIQVTNYPENTRIITEGAVEDSMYIIMEGEVDIYVKGKLRASTADVGIVGEMGLINGDGARQIPNSNLAACFGRTLEPVASPRCRV